MCNNDRCNASHILPSQGSRESPDQEETYAQPMPPFQRKETCGL